MVLAGDSCLLDSVPDDLRAAYFFYLQECNSEKTLTGAQWMRWREHEQGKAEDYYVNNQDTQS
jgi:hypothetical protein